MNFEIITEILKVKPYSSLYHNIDINTFGEFWNSLKLIENSTQS